MKIQIERKEVLLETINVKFPIYSYIEEEDYTLYTKITSNMFYQIRVGSIDVNISKFKKTNKIISEIWWNNKSDWKQFQEGKRLLKKYINEL